MDINLLYEIFEKSQKSAGPRYTPAIDSEAPNIEIEPLQDAISGILCGPNFTVLINDLASSLEKQFKNSGRLRKSYSRHFRYPKGIIDSLQELSVAGPGNSLLLIRQLTQKCRRHLITIEKLSKKLLGMREDRNILKKTKHGYHDNEMVAITRAQNELIKYQTAVENVCQFLKSPACQLVNNNYGLLLGSWGSGKTHFLCDQSKHLLKSNYPVLFLLAKDFNTSSPTRSILKMTKKTKTFATLINRLDKMGKKSGQRALLIIDGINESNSSDWESGIEEILTTIKNKNHVGLLISCRSPFHKSTLKPTQINKAVNIKHPGFHKIEFDAQAEFFSHYKIPLPDVPLLADEFSKPLTLKIMCTAFKKMSGEEQKKGFSGISSGQKGMTYILEKFIKTRSKALESRLNIKIGTCWKFIKGDNNCTDDLLSGLAPYMATTLQDYVSYEDCLAILLNQDSIEDKNIAMQLCESLVDEGILQEDEQWRSPRNGGSSRVIRLPYQRFGDHIVARHLLSKYLDTTDEVSIRRSLYKNRPIGRIFDFKQFYYGSYSMDSWAEAIAVEFPERVKNALSEQPEVPKELIYYLPKGRRLISPYKDIFISGLFWRSPMSFCVGTRSFTDHMIWQTDKGTQHAMFDALVSIATKHDHPYNATTLYCSLKKLSISERDLSWSEFIRESSYSDAVERILLWLEHAIPQEMGTDSAKNLILLVSLILTTTDRLIRDRATKVLVLLGEKYPNELFSVTCRLLDFNDIYVPERLLSACYGVSMSLWHDKGNVAFHNEIIPFAKQLVKGIFSASPKLATTHSLILDYALGIIQIALLVKPRCIATKDIRLITHPFPEVKSGFPEAVELTDEQVDNVQHAIGMHFSNYTLGRLCEGRSNYDDNHTALKKIRSLIEWRVINIGYDHQKFKSIDNNISQLAYHRGQTDSGKVDRYGKKYSWVAYFELYGLLHKANKLDDEYPEPRPTDSDIDPSFPEAPPAWPPIVSSILKTGPKKELEWLNHGGSPHHRNFHQRDSIGSSSGPWVLLEAHVRCTASDHREYFSFVNGYFVAPEDVASVKERYKNLEHPSDSSNHYGHDTYTFAGEASWSKNFGFGIRNKKGKLTCNPLEMFSSHEQVPINRRLSQGWRELYKIAGSTISANLFSDHYSSEPPPQDEIQVAQWLELLQLIERINLPLPEKDQINIDTLPFNIPSQQEIEQGYQTDISYQKVNGIKMAPASWSYNWESHHSMMNPVSGFQYPHPLVCEALKLQSRNRQIELVDCHGNKASIARASPGSRYSNSSFCYLRKDLLDKYLLMTGQSFVWLTWGERSFNYKKFNGHVKDKHLVESIQNRNNIYRHFTLYRP